MPVPGDCEQQQRSYRTCTDAGCHGSEDVARSLQNTVELRINTLASELNALIAQIPATEFNANDGRYSTGEGARFNYQLATMRGSVIHNPFLLEALLIASIEQVRDDYAVTGITTVSLRRQLGAD
jgi:hypothetical protein